MRNPIVNRCIRMIAEAAASAELFLYQDDQEFDEHPVLSVLKRPNSRQSGKVFLETIYGHLLVSGNAYIELVELGRQPRELHALRPDRVKILADRRGWPMGYEYSTGGKSIRHMIDDAGNSPVLHLSLFHPLDDQYGFPPLQAALMALDVHNAASQWNKSLLDNSARPSGALIYSAKDGNNLSEDQFDRLKRELGRGIYRFTKGRAATIAGRRARLEGNGVIARAIWTSCRPRMVPRGILRWRLVFLRCCWEFLATTPIRTIAKQIGPSGGKLFYLCSGAIVMP